MNKKLAIVGSIVGVVILVGLGLAWWLGLFDEPEAEVSLAESAALVTGADVTTTVADSSTDEAAVATDTSDGGAYGDDATSAAEADESTTTTPAAAGPVTSLDGAWQVVPSEATFVGYRVNEVLGGIGDFTAVGRTAAVTGELLGEGLTISSVAIVADLTQLVSDNGARDAQMRRQGLETETFPEATFVLTQPIVLGEIPDDGVTLSATGVGELTLHGVTNTIEITIEGQVVAGQLLVVGSTDIAMADYGIDPPSAPVVASVEDVGVMEFSLVFARS